MQSCMACHPTAVQVSGNLRSSGVFLLPSKHSLLPSPWSVGSVLPRLSDHSPQSMPVTVTRVLGLGPAMTYVATEKHSEVR